MTDIEKPTDRLNSLQHSLAVYNALMALSPSIRAAKENGQHEALSEAMNEH